MEINIGIAEQDRAAIAEGLSRLLADTYLLYLKTHNFHWNVEGPMFQTLHDMFMAQYTETWNAIDPIAERIRALGGIAPGSMAAFLKLARLSEDVGKPPLDSLGFPVTGPITGIYHATVVCDSWSLGGVAQEGPFQYGFVTVRVEPPPFDPGGADRHYLIDVFSVGSEDLHHQLGTDLHDPLVGRAGGQLQQALGGARIEGSLAARIADVGRNVADHDGRAPSVERCGRRAPLEGAALTGQTGVQVGHPAHHTRLEGFSPGTARALLGRAPLPQEPMAKTGASPGSFGASTELIRRAVTE